MPVMKMEKFYASFLFIFLAIYFVLGKFTFWLLELFSDKVISTWMGRITESVLVFYNFPHTYRTIYTWQRKESYLPGVVTPKCSFTDFVKTDL